MTDDPAGAAAPRQEEVKVIVQEMAAFERTHYGHAAGEVVDAYARRLRKALAAPPDVGVLFTRLERVWFRKVGNTFEQTTIDAVQAILAEALVAARVLGHGDGQEHAIADVNAGRVDDLIEPRLTELHALQQALAALAQQWRDAASRSRPLECAPVSAAKRERVLRWMLLTNCANQLLAVLNDERPVTRSDLGDGSGSKTTQRRDP
jgi:HAMP domain-containing protein